jgi:tripartite-type tricarboxylate transporter receptor subunit TctC
VLKAMAQADVAETIAKLGGEPLPMSVSEFDAFLRKELKLNAEIVAVAGIKPQ